MYKTIELSAYKLIMPIYSTEFHNINRPQCISIDKKSVKYHKSD